MNAYVYSLVGNQSQAADVVQETNLVLWRKIDQFDPDKPFLPWALAFARFQVLANLRDRNRDRVLLDDELVHRVASVVETQVDQLEDFRKPLSVCLEQLSDKNRDLIRQRYDHQRPIAEIAEQLGRSAGAIKTALTRVRQNLLQCITDQMEVANR